MRSLVKEFLALESASSIILLMMAVFAIMFANSPIALEYQQLSNMFSPFINEGLMAIFFLVVGLELKRGFVEGALSRFSHVALPAVAALGGMFVPALVYFGINQGNAVTVNGWAIPTATDIAFAVGVLSLFGKRVPHALKLFLLALAIFDDMGAIIIIAVFYAKHISYFMLFQAFILFIVLCLLGRYFLNTLLPYLLIGILLWLCLLYSGIHPTIAGVLLALTIPTSLSKRLEAILHPWVAYVVMPLFALVNAGVSLSGVDLPIITDVVVLGITLGLFIGKQVGVFGFAWLMIQSKIVNMPEGASWTTLYGVALLCGIGFTMSLFLGTLSFPGGHYLTEVRLGVIFGSLLSGLVGAFVLLIAFAQRRNSIAK